MNSSQTIENSNVLFEGNKKALHPKARMVFFIRPIISLFAVLFVFVYIAYIQFVVSGIVESVGIFIIIGAFIFGLIFISIISWFISALLYKSYIYVLGKDVCSIEYGIIHKRHISLPYDNMQNVDIRRDLYDRFLGLSTVHIQTAGTLSYDEYNMAIRKTRHAPVNPLSAIPGLSKEYAEKLRDKLIKRFIENKKQIFINNNKELVDYIKKQIKAGLSKEEIKESLEYVGWNNHKIYNAFYSIDLELENLEPKYKFIPSFTSKGKQKIQPNSRWFFFPKYFNWIIVGLLVLGFPFVLLVSINPNREIDSFMVIFTFMLFFTFIFLGTAFLLWWSKKAYENYSFEFGEELFKKESGVISKHYASIPYTRIQNVDVHRSLLERFLGLSSLQLQTAGGSIGAEGVLPGLEPQQAEKLKKEIMDHVNQFKDQRA